MQSLKLAIEDRDVTAIMNIFFSRHPFVLRDGMKREDPLWDFKEECPPARADQSLPWAKIAADVLGFHNCGGGVLLFGIADDFSTKPLTHSIDSKLFNDQIRKYVGDTLWVSFNRESCKGGYIGVAVIPPRGLNVVRARADAPPDYRGHQYFLALDICLHFLKKPPIRRHD
jgi:hypothetical protein